MVSGVSWGLCGLWPVLQELAETVRAREFLATHNPGYGNDCDKMMSSPTTLVEHAAMLDYELCTDLPMGLGSEQLGEAGP